uniref:Uncharacterized protein n=1 Tax=Lepeophtheirus salmonis TaxID=72036 RepID=A0A0K2TDY8_LEPSM
MSQQEATSGVRSSGELINQTRARTKVLTGTEVPLLSGQQQTPPPKLNKREGARREANRIRNAETRAVETTTERIERLKKIRDYTAATRARESSAQRNGRLKEIRENTAASRAEVSPGNTTGYT